MIGAATFAALRLHDRWRSPRAPSPRHSTQHRYPSPVQGQHALGRKADHFANQQLPTKNSADRLIWPKNKNGILKFKSNIDIQGEYSLSTLNAPALSELRLVSIDQGTGQATVLTIPRRLKNFTGTSILSGGTLNTKTVLMQVDLPDGCLLDYKAGISVSAIFGYSQNTNTKSIGIDIGTSAATALNLWERSRSAGTSGADSAILDFQRSPQTSSKIIMGYGAAVAIEGSTNIAVSSYTQEININPESTGLKLFFWGTLKTSTSDQITLARAIVDWGVAEQ